MKKLFTISTIILSFFLTACAGKKESYDYSMFLDSKPRSILVMMPTNDSSEVKAGAAVLANAVKPLSEAGYYVFPVALVNDTFKHNGLSEAHDIQRVSAQKLREIFAADTALYLNIKEYGSSYVVFSSVTSVKIEAKLIDLKNGATLWSGSASASSNEQNNSGGGIIGQLVAAVVTQIVNTVADKSFDVSAIATQRLFNTGYNGALLYGPYSPIYQKDPQLSK